MTYEQVKNLKPEDFKRLCGVRQETFTQMVSVVQAHSQPKQKTGRPGKLSLEDQVLMTLEYWRERLLVTSANFTEAAHERNIEAGVLLADLVAARAMRTQFETLVAKNILRRVPGL